MLDVSRRHWVSALLSDEKELAFIFYRDINFVIKFEVFVEVGF